MARVRIYKDGGKVTEKQYQAWRSTLPKGLQYEGDYDLRGYYDKYRGTHMAANGHLTDEFKLPNHPTFSNESIYFPQSPWSAGHWQGIPQGPQQIGDEWVPFNPAVKQPIEEYQYGGTMKKKIRITGTPTMEWGGKLPGTGMNINGGYPNQNIDNRWYQYGIPANVYAYAPNPYETKKQLPTVPEDQADIVVEKQEQIIGDFDGDGQQELMGVNAGSHASGNDAPVNVPDGSFVFSDTPSLKIKDKDILKQFGGGGKAQTPAQLAKKFDLQKFSAMMQNPDSDPLAKKTAQMMYQNYENKLADLADIQEGMKSAMEQKKMQRQQMKYGGVPQYPVGGPYAGYYGYPAIEANQREMEATKPNAAWFANNIMSPTNAGVLNDNQNGYRTGFLNAAQNTPEADRTPMDIQPLQPVVPPPVDMYSQQTPWTGSNTTSAQPTIGTPDSAGKRRVRIGLPGLNPDQLGDLSLGLKAMNLQKYKPWEPPVTSVIPEATFLDPTRELAANSEQAAMAYNAAAQSGNAKAARAVGAGYQGQALKNAADIIGRYNNSNVQIANQAKVSSTQIAANITNETMEKQRERQKSLYQDAFNANRLYQGELNQVSDDMVKRAYQKEDSARNRAWMNLNYPMINFDQRGFPVFHSEAEKQRVAADLQRMQAGHPIGSSTSYNDIYQHYLAQYGDPEKAKEQAMNDYNDLYRESMGIGARTTTTRKEGKEIIKQTTPGKKMGGFTQAQVRRFIGG